jgi:uncharacterized protein
MAKSLVDKKQAAEDKKLFVRLKSKKPRDLDQHIHKFHHEAFQKINCLDCANCCKTTGPLFTEKDVARLGKYLNLSRQQFISKYLRTDEDGDWVLQQLPCPFLEADNKCGVYDYRPQACSQYPHTDRIKQHQILNLTEKNVLICPAVREITDRLKQVYMK